MRLYWNFRGQVIWHPSLERVSRGSTRRVNVVYIHYEEII